MTPTATSVRRAADIASKAKDGQPQVVGSAPVLRVLRANAEAWGIRLKPYNASSWEVVAK